MSKKIKVILSSKLVNQVTCLHREIGNIEWSGTLLYSVESGSIEGNSELILKAQELWLMDIGSHSYTEISFDSSIMDMYEAIPNSDPFNTSGVNYKMGLIHTHHNMNAFISGTDKDEIVTNSPKHNYYLSLIVNYDGKYVAAVGVAGETEVITKRTFKGITSETTQKSNEVQIINCDIEFENSDSLLKRIDKIKEEKERNKPKQVFSSGFSYGFQNRSIPDSNINRINSIEDKYGKNFAKSQIKQTINLFGDVPVSRVQLINYLRELVDIGTSEKHNTLAAALNEVENSNIAEIRIWEELIQENYEQVFDQMFPNANESVYDVCGELIAILEHFSQLETSSFLMSLFSFNEYKFNN